MTQQGMCEPVNKKGVPGPEWTKVDVILINAMITQRQVWKKRVEKEKNKLNKINAILNDPVFLHMVQDAIDWQVSLRDAYTSRPSYLPSLTIDKEVKRSVVPSRCTKTIKKYIKFKNQLMKLAGLPKNKNDKKQENPDD